MMCIKSYVYILCICMIDIYIPHIRGTDVKIKQD